VGTQRQHLSPTVTISSLAAIGLVVLLVHEFMNSNTPRSAPIQSVALIAPPPAPPPPEPQKPPEEKVEPVKPLDASDWTPGEAGASPGPVSDPGLVRTDSTLGLDEAGASGSDAFGLAGKPGGHELLLTTASGGGNPLARFMQYANEIQEHIQAQINQIGALRQSCYTARVGIWIDAGGSISNVKIQKSSGDRELDSEIRGALLALPPMGAAPPSDMPWPVGLQVVAQRADCASSRTSTAPQGAQ
jgi:TonB family protein